MAKSGTFTFTEALARSETVEGGRSVLLGNGFSIDWKPEVFTYESLFDEATLADLSVDKADLFDSLGTRDFEQVIQYLRATAGLLGVYEGNPDLVRSILDDAGAVRNALAEVLARRHPHTSTEMSDDEARHAQKFLSNFGRVFTLNYDLLLYWAVNRQGIASSAPRQDGFEWPTHLGGDLIWKRKAAERGQRVFYLHGGLHLFVEGDRRLHKLSYSLDGPLVGAVRGRLDDGQYPLVVTEGRREEKEDRIDRSAYLRYCHRKFSELRGSLFVHGVSFSPNDEHIFGALEAADCQVSEVYVALHGPRRKSKAVEDRARLLRTNRREAGGRKLKVHFYSSDSARVWR